MKHLLGSDFVGFLTSYKSIENTFLNLAIASPLCLIRLLVLLEFFAGKIYLPQKTYLSETI